VAGRERVMRPLFLEEWASGRSRSAKRWVLRSAFFSGDRVVTRQLTKNPAASQIKHCD
jgi:hypothetical protein